MTISRHRVRRAAKNDVKQVEKVITVQEAQIQALTAQVAAQDAVIVGLCERYVWDHIDPNTGEVKKGWQYQ
jgi:protein-tyrosine-phosphatase